MFFLIRENLLNVNDRAKISEIECRNVKLQVRIVFF